MVGSFEVCVCLLACLWVFGVSERPGRLVSWPGKGSQAGSVQEGKALGLASLPAPGLSLACVLRQAIEFNRMWPRTIYSSSYLKFVCFLQKGETFSYNYIMMQQQHELNFFFWLVQVIVMLIKKNKNQLRDLYRNHVSPVAPMTTLTCRLLATFPTCQRSSWQHHVCVT